MKKILITLTVALIAVLSFSFTALAENSIDRITLSFSAPSAGAEASSSALAGSITLGNSNSCRITESNWLKETENTPGSEHRYEAFEGTFEADTRYYAGLTLQTEPGYTLSQTEEGVTTKVKGATLESAVYAGNRSEAPGTAHIIFSFVASDPGSQDKTGHRHTYEKHISAAGYLEDGCEYYICTECGHKTEPEIIRGWSKSYAERLRVKEGGRSFTVKWLKQPDSIENSFSGYQIRYSKNSDFSDAVYKTEPSSSSGIRIKAEPNTKYYVQVRTYVTSKGEEYFSGWSRTLIAETY